MTMTRYSNNHYQLPIWTRSGCEIRSLENLLAGLSRIKKKTNRTWHTINDIEFGPSQAASPPRPHTSNLDCLNPSYALETRHPMPLASCKVTDLKGTSSMFLEDSWNTGQVLRLQVLIINYWGAQKGGPRSTIIGPSLRLVSAKISAKIAHILYRICPVAFVKWRTDAKIIRPFAQFCR